MLISLSEDVERTKICVLLLTYFHLVCSHHLDVKTGKCALSLYIFNCIQNHVHEKRKVLMIMKLNE